MECGRGYMVNAEQCPWRKSLLSVHKLPAKDCESVLAQSFDVFFNENPRPDWTTPSGGISQMSSSIGSFSPERRIIRCTGFRSVLLPVADSKNKTARTSVSELLALSPPAPVSFEMVASFALESMMYETMSTC